jgi:hypothetical protein
MLTLEETADLESSRRFFGASLNALNAAKLTGPNFDTRRGVLAAIAKTEEEDRIKAAAEIRARNDALYGFGNKFANVVYKITDNIAYSAATTNGGFDFSGQTNAIIAAYESYGMAGAAQVFTSGSIGSQSLTANAYDGGGGGGGSSAEIYGPPWPPPQKPEPTEVYGPPWPPPERQPSVFDQEDRDRALLYQQYAESRRQAELEAQRKAAAKAAEDAKMRAAGVDPAKPAEVAAFKAGEAKDTVKTLDQQIAELEQKLAIYGGGEVQEKRLMELYKQRDVANAAAKSAQSDAVAQEKAAIWAAGLNPYKPEDVAKYHETQARVKVEGIDTKIKGLEMAIAAGVGDPDIEIALAELRQQRDLAAAKLGGAEKDAGLQKRLAMWKAGLDPNKPEDVAKYDSDQGAARLAALDPKIAALEAKVAAGTATAEEKAQLADFKCERKSIVPQTVETPEMKRRNEIRAAGFDPDKPEQVAQYEAAQRGKQYDALTAKISGLEGAIAAGVGGASAEAELARLKAERSGIRLATVQTPEMKLQADMRLAGLDYNDPVARVKFEADQSLAVRLEIDAKIKGLQDARKAGVAPPDAEAQIAALNAELKAMGPGQTRIPEGGIERIIAMSAPVAESDPAKIRANLEREIARLEERGDPYEKPLLDRFKTELEAMPGGDKPGDTAPASALVADAGKIAPAKPGEITIPEGDPGKIVESAVEGAETRQWTLEDGTVITKETGTDGKVILSRKTADSYQQVNPDGTIAYNTDEARYLYSADGSLRLRRSDGTVEIYKDGKLVTAEPPKDAPTGGEADPQVASADKPAGSGDIVPPVVASGEAAEVTDAAAEVRDDSPRMSFRPGFKPPGSRDFRAILGSSEPVLMSRASLPITGDKPVDTKPVVAEAAPVEAKTGGLSPDERGADKPADKPAEAVVANTPEEKPADPVVADKPADKPDTVAAAVSTPPKRYIGPNGRPTGAV